MNHNHSNENYNYSNVNYNYSNVNHNSSNVNHNLSNVNLNSWTALLLNCSILELLYYRFLCYRTAQGPFPKGIKAHPNSSELSNISTQDHIQSLYT
jgi:hypothetical protein